MVIIIREFRMNTMIKYIKPYHYVIVFIILFLLASYFFMYLHHFDNKVSDSVIPKQVFLTWKTTDLPEKMAISVEKLKRDNPELEYHFYDDKDQRNFIEKNFDDDVLKTYDALVPGAYKADLWRYCALYKFGGIYLDIKYHTVNGFKLVTMTDKEYFVRDIAVSGSGIYNAFIVVKPGNQKMINCINDIVKNVKNKYYGNSSLDPTGPMLLIKQFDENELSKFDNIEHKWHSCINKDNTTIMAYYDGYLDEKQQYLSQNNTKDYTDLWAERKIYNDSVAF